MRSLCVTASILSIIPAFATERIMSKESRSLGVSVHAPKKNSFPPKLLRQ